MTVPNSIANFKHRITRRALLMAVIVNAAVCLALPDYASGQTVRFNFEARIRSTGGLSAFSVGDTIIGSYTFDGAAPDLDGSAARGFYETVVSLAFVTSAGYSASATAGASRGFIEVLNNVATNPGETNDRYVMGMDQTYSAPLVDGKALNALRIVLRSTSTTVFPSDALPLLPPQLVDFDRGNDLILEFNGVESVNAMVTSLTVDSADPVIQIGVLIQAVEILESAGSLEHGVSSALLAKLEGAMRQAESHPNAAIGMLTAFIHQVNALVSRGDLSPAEGGSLITGAEGIIAALTVP